MGNDLHRNNQVFNHYFYFICSKISDIITTIITLETTAITIISPETTTTTIATSETTAITITTPETTTTAYG
jgi:hypothetical protein